MSYEINARGCLIRRHIDQLRLRVEDNVPDDYDLRIPLEVTPDHPPRIGDISTTSLRGEPSNNSAESANVDSGTVQDPIMTPIDIHSEFVQPATDEPILRRSTRVRYPPKFLGIDD